MTKPHPISRAEYARRVGRARSAITAACNGPLAAACLDGARINAAHPAAVAFAAKRGVSVDRLLADATAAEGTATAPTPPRASARRPPRAPMRKSAVQGVSYLEARFISLEGLAMIAGEATESVDRAALSPATLIADDGSPCVDLLSPIVLRYLASRPFERDDAGELLEDEIPEGAFAGAFLDEDIDVDHPLARAFLTRCWGEAATDELLVERARAAELEAAH